jgi:hypothetical protein
MPTTRSISLFALGLLAAGCPLLLAGFLVPGLTALAALWVGLLPAALALLGLASRWRGLRGRVPIALTLAAVALGPFAVYLATVRRPPEGGAWWLGLPAPTAGLVFGVGLAGLVVTGVLYAWTFRHAGVRDEDLERIARLAGAGDDAREPPR